MSLSVVSVVADPRPVQKGVETDAHAFDQLMGAAALDALQELFGNRWRARVSSRRSRPGSSRRRTG